jgi:hypothetical protein
MANGKNGKGVIIMAATIIGLIGAVIVAGLSYGSLSTKVEQNEKASEMTLKNREAVIRLQSDVGYIKERVDGIYKHLTKAHP